MWIISICLQSSGDISDNKSSVDTIIRIFVKFEDSITIMLGAIIGDIVGSVYEFDNTKSTDFPFFSDREATISR